MDCNPLSNYQFGGCESLSASGLSIKSYFLSQICSRCYEFMVASMDKDVITYQKKKKKKFMVASMDSFQARRVFWPKLCYLSAYAV